MSIIRDGEEIYQGRVLGRYERNWYDDSDFYAIVMDVGGTVTATMVGTTRWALSERVTIDATDDTLARARENLAPRLAERMAHEHTKPKHGNHVRSLTTKGKARGITGTVERVEPSKYQVGQHVARVRVDGPESNVHYGRCVYVDVTRLEVTDEPTDLLEQAYAYIDRYGFRSAYLRTVGQ